MQCSRRVDVIYNAKSSEILSWTETQNNTEYTDPTRAMSCYLLFAGPGDQASGCQSSPGPLEGALNGLDLSFGSLLSAGRASAELVTGGGSSNPASWVLPAATSTFPGRSLAFPPVEDDTTPCNCSCCVGASKRDGVEAHRVSASAAKTFIRS